MSVGVLGAWDERMGKDSLACSRIDNSPCQHATVNSVLSRWLWQRVNWGDVRWGQVGAFYSQKARIPAGHGEQTYV